MISYRFSLKPIHSEFFQIDFQGGDAALAFCCGCGGAAGLGTVAADWRSGGSAGGAPTGVLPKLDGRMMKLRNMYGIYDNIWKRSQEPRE